MEISRVLSEAWALYKRFPGQFILTALPVYLVLGLVNAAIASVADEGWLAILLWGAIGLVVTIIGYFWLQGALVEAVQDVRDGRADLSVGDLYRRVSPRLPALISAGILAGLGIAVGLVLLVVPGLFLLTRWVLIAPVIVIEERSAGDSFGRSWELVKGSSWPVFGLIVVTVIGVGIVSALIQAVFAFLPNFFDTWVGDVVANSLTAPFIVLAWTLAYYELRGQREPAPEEPLPAAP